MNPRRSTLLRFVMVFVAIGSLGIAATVYTLVKQRVPLPLGDTYELQAAFGAADGVLSGVGQPVNVVGVNVGQVRDVRVKDGRALVTMSIERKRLRQVYADASATLRPITPLKDMQISLDPGTAGAGPMATGRVLSIDRTTTPADLSDVLSSLDGDTRQFLTGLIASLDQGTRGREADIRGMLAQLSPTAIETGRLARAVAARRTAMTRLVHNLGDVAHAVSDDRQLASVVQAGGQTLRALAEQNRPLQSAIAQLPGTLAQTRRTLDDVSDFASTLGPSLSALTPAVRRLPGTLRTLRPFTDEATVALRKQIRPLVRAAVPVASRLDPAVVQLRIATPKLTSTFQSLQYFVNELAYNPAGDDEGFLHWMSWFFHNLNSLASSGDANGAIGRTTVMATCYGLQGRELLQDALDVIGLCPE